ncbi:MAG: dTDP-4-amino-4,6-dideoxygalactose transaminase [Peptostreptococcaceae bacterium]|nr:dTDP-4-amino-4,6-dideoxygalactose transaminase [Peptostreptococcaceae bacterium]
MKIPFNRTIIGRKEKEAVLSALEKGSISGGGIFTRHVEKKLKRLLGGRTVLATTSGTHSLEMAARLSGLKPRDEVVMPSYTYPSTANCILKVGAKPIFADVAAEGMNVGFDEIKEKITGRTRAILAVHYGGISRDVKALRELADSQGLMLIEDAAQALGSEESGRQLGTWGDFGCFSFHATKNFKAGEGGALVIGKSHENLLSRAEAIRNGGTDKARFLRGETINYQWVEEGSMYLPSDLLMALLGPQLDEMDSIIRKRIFVFEAYERLLEKYRGCKFIIEHSQSPADGRAFNAHLFFIVFESREARRFFQGEMEKASIQAFSHFWPLHSSSMGIAMGYKDEDLPRTSEKAAGLVRLPLYENLRADELEYVISKADRILNEMARGE